MAAKRRNNVLGIKYIITQMNPEFSNLMKGIQDDVLKNISEYYKDTSIAVHIFGSHSKGTNDALSDLDIWITFDDADIQKAIESRSDVYSKFGKIVLLHELQNNFPLNGIQSAIIYEIQNELIRVDYYLCPLSSSRIVEGSKIIFQRKPIEIGPIIPETKRTSRDKSDRITFLISMCFVGIKKIVRGNYEFIDFLVNEFKKSNQDFPEFSKIPTSYDFDTLKAMLSTLAIVSNKQQQDAIDKIKVFLIKVESLHIQSTCAHT